MVIRHGGLTAEERIKKAVEVCKDRCSPYCPYWTEDECRTLILTDCAEAIAEREERIAIMQESMETLEKRCNALEALEQRCKTLEVLEKRNEPVEPKEIISDFYTVGDYRRTLGWLCGKCGGTLKGDGDFCSYCGQAVKWE